MADTKPNDSEIKYYAVCETEAMNIRLGPSLASSVVSKAPTKVHKGEKLSVYDIDSDNWMKIWHDNLNKFVYVHKTNKNKTVFKVTPISESTTTTTQPSSSETTSKETDEERKKYLEELNKQPTLVMGTGMVLVTYIPYVTAPSETASTVASKGLKPTSATYGDEVAYYDSIQLASGDVYVRGPNVNSTTPSWLKAYDGKTKTDWLNLRFNRDFTTRKVTSEELTAFGGDSKQATTTEEEQERIKTIETTISNSTSLGKGIVKKSTYYLTLPNTSSKANITPSTTTVGDEVTIYDVGKYNNYTYIQVLHPTKKFVWLVANSSKTTVMNGSSITVIDPEIYVECEFNNLKNIQTLTYEQLTVDPNEIPELNEEEKKKKEEYMSTGVAIGTAYVIGDKVNYRTQPSIVCSSYESKKVTPYTATKGSSIPFYDIVNGADNCTYVKVIHPSNEYAWLMASRKASTMTSEVDNNVEVNIAEEKYLQLTLYGDVEIKEITIDDVINSSTTTVPVEVKEVEAKNAEGELETLKSIGYCVVTDAVTYLNFRTNPSTSAKTYAQKGIKRYYALPGEKYDIYDVSGDWVKVIHPETNNQAWLANKRIILNGNKEAKYLDITLYDITTEPSTTDEVPVIDTGTPPDKLDINNEDEKKAADEYYNNLFDDNWYEYLGNGKSKYADDDIAISTKHSTANTANTNLSALVSSYNNAHQVSDPLTGEIDQWKAAINVNGPSVVQNDLNFPRIISNSSGIYKYDYAQNYYDVDYNNGLGLSSSTTNSNEKTSTFDLMMKNLRRVLDIPSMDSYYDAYSKQLHMYNRFKLPTTNDQLTTSFSHIFFTKPDLNIFGENGVLDKKTGIEPYIENIYKMKPTLFSQLTLDNADGIDQESGTRFMMYLSNKSASIDMSDESLDVSEYGETATGFKVIYGKSTLKSKQAGEVTLSILDDKRLTVYNLIRIWIDYISGCYRGLYLPKREYLTYHALDYASSIYYILCAEDGETIIYWAKLYGTFPTNVPSSQYSKSDGTNISLPKGNYTFKYTIKEEMNPMIIHEFNSCTAPIQSKYGSKYVTNYNNETLHAGTWVGAPFITLEKNSAGNYVYKLRFRPYDTTNYRDNLST